MSLLQAFPFPSTGKGDTAPTFSGLHVYLQFTLEVGLPPSPVQFSSFCHSHKLSCYLSLLFLLLITQFLFFHRVGVSLSRELC
jgi:hypothetical protein